MATNSLQAESARANPIDAVNSLACKVQLLLTRASYLADAIEDAADDVQTSGCEISRTALDRMLVFNGMVNEALAIARDQAEDIEALSIAIKQQSS